MPLDVKEDEEVLDTKRMMELADVALEFKSWEDVIATLRNNVKQCHKELRYPRLELEDMPPGSVGDWLVCVLNVFGDVGMKECNGKVPKGIAEYRLVAKLCSEMDTTERTAKQRLNTLKHGNHLKLENGLIVFPVERLRPHKYMD